jgi:hypothetical protein
MKIKTMAGVGIFKIRPMRVRGPVDGRIKRVQAPPMAGQTCYRGTVDDFPFLGRSGPICASTHFGIAGYLIDARVFCGLDLPHVASEQRDG